MKGIVLKNSGKDFFDFGLGTNCCGISHQDLNDIGEASGFYAGTDLTNAPSNKVWFMIIHLSMSEKYKYQEAINASSGAVYRRSCINGTWGDWYAVGLTAI